MNTQTRIKQEISAGRIQSPSYNAGYDTVLPPQGRAELGAPPRRPRILGRPKPKEPTRLSTPRLLFAVFLVLLLVSAICLTLRERVPLERSPSPAGAQQAPQSITVVPTPAPAPRAIAPVPVSPPAPESSPALTLAPMPQITSPQAEHSASATADGTTTPDTNWHSATVLPPPPRAQLVRIPLHIGAQYTVHMPYQNLEALATFKGYLERENLLPTLNNQVGDMWIVDPTPWLWLQAPGADGRRRQHRPRRRVPDQHRPPRAEPRAARW
jgi:hypothetical protein